MISDKNKTKEKAKSTPQAEDFHLRIVPGEYEAVCYKIETGKSWGSRRSIYLLFRITSGEFEGVDLFLAAPYPQGKLNLRHKYYQQWMLAACRPPHKKERLSREAFKNRLFLVLVRDTKRKYGNGRMMPDFMKYSVIDTILKPLSGDYKI